MAEAQAGGLRTLVSTEELARHPAWRIFDCRHDLGKDVVVDARAPARWRGETEPIDPEAGRIPGSLNRFNGANLTAEGVHKDPSALRKEFEALLGGRSPGEVAHSCGSGVAACHNLLAMEIAAHLMRVTETAHWLEWQDWADPILAEPYAVKEGQLVIPDRPGQGIDWDEKAVARYAL